MSFEDVLHRLGVDPAHLDAAPPGPGGMRGYRDLRAGKPCVACSDVADYTTIHDFPEHGPRWVDCCRGHFLAVAKTETRQPAGSAAELVADLREVAAEVGAPIAIVVDEWKGEQRG